MAYVPQFRRDVLDAAAWLRSGGGSPLPFAGLSAEATHRRLMQRAGDDEPEADYRLRGRFQVLLWGPTTAVFVVEISAEEFIEILEGIAAALDAGQSESRS
ncbi:hypothetical protein [Streptomyces goshikiensis]